MAGSGHKAWTREMVPSVDFQSYLQDQVVMRFPSAAARDVALPVAMQGMHCYLDDVDRTMVHDGVGWHIVDPLPSLSVTKGASQTISAGAWTLISWDAPLASRIAAGAAAAGMWTAPGRLVATATGRWSCSLAMNGADNGQIRANSAGSTATGNMVVGGGTGGPSHVNIGREDFILNTGDYLEAFAFRATAGPVGPVATYVSHFAMTYHGRT